MSYSQELSMYEEMYWVEIICKTPLGYCSKTEKTPGEIKKGKLFTGTTHSLRDWFILEQLTAFVMAVQEEETEHSYKQAALADDDVYCTTVCLDLYW